MNDLQRRDPILYLMLLEDIKIESDEEEKEETIEQWVVLKTKHQDITYLIAQL